jgi:hypothetical protein
VREEGLPSQPAQLQPFGLFRVWRLWVIGQCKASQKNRRPDPKDEGRRRWWGLLRSPALGWGLRLRLSSPLMAISLHKLILNLSLCNVFYFYKIGRFSAVLCDFIKISLHVIFRIVCKDGWKVEKHDIFGSVLGTYTESFMLLRWVSQCIFKKN